MRAAIRKTKKAKSVCCVQDQHPTLGSNTNRSDKHVRYTRLQHAHETQQGGWEFTTFNVDQLTWRITHGDVVVFMIIWRRRAHQPPVLGRRVEITSRRGEGGSRSAGLSERGLPASFPR